MNIILFKELYNFLLHHLGYDYFFSFVTTFHQTTVAACWIKYISSKKYP